MNYGAMRGLGKKASKMTGGKRRKKATPTPDVVQPQPVKNTAMTKQVAPGTQRPPVRPHFAPPGSLIHDALKRPVR